MHKEIGVGKAHSKIILIGEHAVVYGYPAIALPLHHIEVICQIIPADSPWILFEDDTLSMAVFASLEHLGIREARIRCRIQSMVPEKRGWGPLRRSVSQLFVQFLTIIKRSWTMRP